MGLLGSLVHSLDKRETVIAKRHEKLLLVLPKELIFLLLSQLACGKNSTKFVFETCLHWSEIAILVGWWHAH
jgi:hypothetical protein